MIILLLLLPRLKEEFQSLSLLVIYIRKLVNEVSKKGKVIRVIRVMRVMRTVRARRKMRVMRKILSNILLSAIDCNLILCQAL